MVDVNGRKAEQTLEQIKMDAAIDTFCTMIENRSNENRMAMQYFTDLQRVLSPAFSILRQELDSMIRVIYLLQIPDDIARKRLIQSTLDGDEWVVPAPKGKSRKVTDREMVELANHLQGWTQSVYKFGCAFIHLSYLHNHFVENPFRKLSATDKQDILSHMRNYHGGPSHDDPGMEEISKYLPKIFDKIADNLSYYVEQLRGNSNHKS